MTPTVLTQYAQRHDTPDAALLGRILWYSVYEMTIHADELRLRLNDAGLGNYMPSLPSDNDIFRRICKEVPRKRQPLPDGTYQNMMVRDVTDGNANQIVRRIVVEKVDSNNKILEYTEAWDLTFDKEHATLTTTKLDTHVPSDADAAVARLADEYRAKRGTFDANGVRALIKKILDDNHAIMVRPTGGVMFAPRQHADTVLQLEDFARGLPEATVHSIPLPDDPSQTNMVGQALTDSIVSDVNGLMGEAQEMLASGDIGKRKLATIQANHRKLKARLRTYQEVLQFNLETITVQLERFDRTIAHVVQQVL